MAIDTTEKKLSLLNFGSPRHRLTLPFADGSLDDGDKLHLLGLYSGITIAPTGFTLPDIVYNLPKRILCFDLPRRSLIFELPLQEQPVEMDRR